MQFPIFGKLEVDTILPFLIWTLFLIVAVIFINKIVKNIFFQSAYLETLRGFAEEHGYKKPISTRLFVFSQITALFLAVIFASAFFRNAYMTVAIVFVVLVIAVIFFVKFYTPTFKAFALAENLTYTSEVVSGEYNGRHIFIVEEKKAIGDLSDSFIDREKRINLTKHIISVSLSLDNEKIGYIKYEDGRITIEPEALGPDLAHPQRMLHAIPNSDNPHLYISKINGSDYLTIEKTTSNFLFIAELYYLCEAAERIMDAVKGCANLGNT